MALDRKITSRGIIVKDGKMFAQKLHGNNFWCTPGGKLDPEETIEAGCIRELIEETGVTPKLGRLLFIQQLIDKNAEYVEFFFHIENPDDYETIDLAATSHGEAEVAEYGFIDPKTEYILPAFLGEIDLQEHIDSGAPVYIHNALDE